MKRFAKIITAIIISRIIIIFAKLSAFSTSRNEYREVVSPGVVILCKKLWHARGAKDRQFLLYLLIYSNELAYLQLLTILVYGSSPPKSHEQG